MCRIAVREVYPAGSRTVAKVDDLWSRWNVFLNLVGALQVESSIVRLNLIVAFRCETLSRISGVEVDRYGLSILIVATRDFLSIPTALCYRLQPSQLRISASLGYSNVSPDRR